MADRVFPAGLTVGDSVEVRRRFDARWAKGFEIAAIEDELVVLRRMSDGAILDRPFGLDDIRSNRD